jgi:hypothetical protein
VSWTRLVLIAALLSLCVYVGAGVYRLNQRRADIQRILQASANIGKQRGPLREKLDRLRRQERVLDEQLGINERAGNGLTINQLALELKYEQTQTELRAVNAEYDALLARLRTLPDAPKLIVDAPAITALAGALGTLFTILFAWRTDRRAAKESELKFVQMQQQITELQRKLDEQSGTAANL